jgi:16S rRNA (adenine1518-N6/adenine1519-N6)-dimethyltransferase
MQRDLSPIKKLRQSGISPEKTLGQNFLIDANILDVIEKMASLSREDIVLEVGPGLGVLTERLLERCGGVHCVEVDTRLADHIEAEFGRRRELELHRLDAMDLDYSVLDPPPGKFVSNLPYNIATPLVMKSLAEMPSIRSWCLMLQKEIADRLFARPGSSNYGGPSVMTQLLTVKNESRPVSGAVFYPRPRVKASLLAFTRRERPGYTASHFSQVRSVVHGAFSHRRKTLVNSLADAESGSLPPGLEPLTPHERKKRIVAALEGMGAAANIRPQDLEPSQHEQLAAALLGEAS